MNKKLFFIDPQSYNNLSNYDYGVLSEISDFKITYFCNKKYDYLPLKYGVTKPIFSYSDYKNPIIKAFSYLSSLIQLFIICLLKRPSVIHIQWLRLPLIEYIMYWTIKKTTNAKIIFTVHNLFPRKCSEKVRLTYIKFYKICDALIAHTETSKKNLITQESSLHEKIHIIPHGILSIQCDDNNVNSEIQTIFTKYNLNGKIIFAHVGGQTTYKGSDLLLNTWINSSELANNPDVVLFQAGKNYDLNIPDKLPDNLLLIPRLLSDAEFLALIRMSDVVLMPYRAIDQSGIILTLINENAPYCVSNVGELTAPFKIADIGWTFKEISEEGIASTIQDIIQHKEDIKLKKEDLDSWNKLKTIFNWETISHKTQSLYHSLNNGD